MGELVVPRRVLGMPRAARIVPRGEAWHLGALLLTADRLLATGEIVRAREEVRRGFAAESQRARAELAAAARRGGFPEGTTVHIGWTVLDPDAVDRDEASGPLSLLAGTPSIRWSPGGGRVPLDRYLDERVELLRHPPAGAG
nr:glutaminase [Microbacterium ulmi]